MKKNILDDFCNSFPEVKKSLSVPWKNLTTMGIGSLVPILIEPKDDAELVQILKYCYDRKIKILPLGAGSNIIGTDKPYNGIILKLTQNAFTTININQLYITAGAGVKLIDLITTAANNNLGGMEALAGIPGTIGGSLRTNAGRFDVTISDTIENISGFTLEGKTWSTTKNDIKWGPQGYHYSSFPKNVIITSIIFKFKTANRNDVLSQMQATIAERNSIYPEDRSAGCIFINPPSGTRAGKLIDKSGCKGMNIGDAEVSLKHANFIVNKANATEKDFLSLAIKVREQVLKKTGIYLTPEVCFANERTLRTLQNTPKKIKVAILKGGNSHERPVSLISAKGVYNALKDAGYKVKGYDIKAPLINGNVKKADIVFPVLHGGFGENGEIQRELEKYALAYVGCDSKASELSIDKIKTKEIFIKNNIPTPGYAILKYGETTFPSNLTLPVVVKPPTEGSTFGISIVKKMEDWIPALQKAQMDNYGYVLVEQFISGYEMTCGVLNGIALPLVHISYTSEMYDYDAKYTHKTCETLYITPPDKNILPEEQQEQIKTIAAKIYKVINARHMARIDVMISKKDLKPYFLEVNTIPGFTPNSLLPKAAAAVDIPYIQLCGTLVQRALDKSVEC